MLDHPVRMLKQGLTRLRKQSATARNRLLADLPSWLLCSNSWIVCCFVSMQFLAMESKEAIPKVRNPYVSQSDFVLGP